MKGSCIFILKRKGNHSNHQLLGVLMLLFTLEVVELWKHKKLEFWGRFKRRSNPRGGIYNGIYNAIYFIKKKSKLGLYCLWVLLFLKSFSCPFLALKQYFLLFWKAYLIWNCWQIFIGMVRFALSKHWEEDREIKEYRGWFIWSWQLCCLSLP